MTALVAAAAALSIAPAYARSGGASWSMSGQGITNWRYQPDESKLNQGNVKSQLSLQWATQLGGEISATPAVVDGVAYVPDWGGYLSAVDTDTGTVIWQQSVTALAGASGPMVVDSSGHAVPGTGPVVSRTSPAVSGRTVVIGTQAMMSAVPGVGAGAQLIAVDKRDGHLLWRHKLDDHPLSIDTASPTIYNGVAYVGVASVEENGIDCGASTNACYFRGSVNAVKLANGSLLWKTYTITAKQSLAGYSGAAVWGSSPAIDVDRNSVYIGTGNNYGAPKAVSDCVTAAGTDPKAIFSCEDTLGRGNDVDAIMSLSLTTGSIRWAHKLQGFDAWTTACIGLPTACPSPNGPDYDFGQGPMLIPADGSGHGDRDLQGNHGDRDIVAAGQKSGLMWGLDADTGATVWSTAVGPGSSLGGMEWGSATDGKRIYFAVANFNVPAQSYPMVNPPKGTPATSSAGSWGAVDAATGKILWQTADPNGSIDLGPVSVANGVVYASSMGALFFPGVLPTMFALDAKSGKQLWSFASGGSVNAGPAIVDGTVYWGSGYTHLGFGGGNNQLFAFGR
ncbi:MAG TPA: PQQ-binding-like beta-propeller repeat protein [Gaiellaceae bacterium]|nr:PQQ-binding-like beta-propeller repeat protein [Gaiellaceae bacterium]